MRVSVPGLEGVYYDTDTGTTALGVALTAAGRKAPKPKGYAVQLLPYLWSFDVDLREVPNNHPIQYLHPEGAQSLGELSPQRGVRQAGTELESVLRFIWSVNQEVESAATGLFATDAPADGDEVVIEIQEGSVSVGGDELATDEFDLEESATAETDTVTNVEIDDEMDAGGETDADSETDAGDEANATDETDSDADVFGATEEPPADEEVETDDEFGFDDESDDIDPDEP